MMGTRNKQRQQNNVKTVSNTQALNPQRISPPPFLQQHSSSSSKFELEPNPFEQSFILGGKSDQQQQQLDGARKADNVLPPVADIDTPSDGANLARGNPLWDSLRSGPLSPSMLGGPQPPPPANDSRNAFGPNMLHPQVGHAMAVGPSQAAGGMPNTNLMNKNSMAPYEPVPGVQPNNLYLLSAAQQEVMRRSSLAQEVPNVKTETDEFGHSQLSNSPPTRRRATTSPDSSNDDVQPRRNNRRRSSSSKRTDGDESEKRKSFLERNRQAALKCRQRKKQWLSDLQNKVEYLSNDNEKLQSQATSLREEIINLKTLLLAHKDCAVAQANGVIGLEQLRAAPGMLLRPNVQNSAPMNMFGGATSTSFRTNAHVSSAQDVTSRGY